MNRSEWFAATLADFGPGRILAVRYEGPLAALSDAARATGTVIATWLQGIGTVGGLDGQGRYDAAVVVDQLEHMPADARRHLLVRLRDLHASRVVVCVRETVAREWPANDWRALQFLPGQPLDEPGASYSTYAFDLATYNPERTWNTPEHWANPGNFTTHRW